MQKWIKRLFRVLWILQVLVILGIGYIVGDYQGFKDGLEKGFTLGYLTAWGQNLGSQEDATPDSEERLASLPQ